MAISNSKTIIALLSLAWLASCNKWDDYKKYQQKGEIVYPGTITDAQAHPGAGRILLTWTPSIDPSVKKYTITWNNGADSLAVDANSHNPADTARVMIDHLDERTYFFAVYSLDDKGNRSVAANIQGVKAYGPIYQGGLFNRTYSSYDYTAGTLSLIWNVPDTINIRTEIQYTDTNDVLKTTLLSPGQDTLLIPDWKGFGSLVYYRSAYIPVRTAIDTFWVNHYDSLKLVYKYDGSYHSTGVFHHPANGDRTIDRDKTLTRVDDSTSQTELGDLLANGYLMNLRVNPDNSVTVIPAGSTPDIDQHWGPNFYDPVSKSFNLYYSYNTAAPRIIQEVIKLK
jgi:hypothetical protein